MWQAGPTNTLVDVKGLSIGAAEDAEARTGTSVIVFDEPATASVSILGQAPGTRESALLDPSRTVAAIDALVLSGGSAFGLSAAGAVMQELATAGRGYEAAGHRVPIVPAAILFDLANDGSKPADLSSLYAYLGKQAWSARTTKAVRLGATGAGAGATTGGGPGGLGSASCVFDKSAPKQLAGHTIAALVAVNAVGSPYLGDGPHFRAAPFELNGEFGGFGMPEHLPDPALPRMKTLAKPGDNTTIGCVATSLTLTKAACHGLAIAGQDGIAAAIYPAHTSLDGDLIFAASTGSGQTLDDPALLALVQAAATATMARAIARGVHAATKALAAPSQT
jgi:L-aminopeptidase/D-esterase-like protein